VQLSAQGAAFLEHARELLEVHDRALAVFAGARQRLTIGISDHVAGPELPALIARMNAQDPQLLIEIRIGSPSPAACVRWPGSFSMRQACPGRKFSSAAALRRSLRPSWPGSASLHWLRACCHLAQLT